VTHRHSQHTVCDGVSGVTEEGYLHGVPVCLVSVTGSAVRVGQRVFSVFFAEDLRVSTVYRSRANDGYSHRIVLGGVCVSL